MGIVVNPLTVGLFAVVVGFAVYRSTANLTGGIGDTVKTRAARVV